MKILLLVLAASSAYADPEFGTYWHDGKAELDGYRLTVQRYGHPRGGRAVLIYVTEPFSASRHVKLDDPARTPADSVDVLKLNLTRDFQTGIYDYHTLLSLFVRADDLSPLKSAFSASEWCGQVYEELSFAAGKLDAKFFSYFEGESSATSETPPAGGVLEDQLFILLRGLRGEYLRPGERRTVPFLESAFFRRLGHRKLAWAPASLERSAAAQLIKVPAGSIRAVTYVVKPADGRVGRFDVEEAYPHRLVRWSWSAAANAPPTIASKPLGGTDTAELTGTARLEYWKLHDPGDEKHLRELGLKVPPSPLGVK